MAITALRRVQFGLESTPGTPVAADTMMLGRMTWNPTLELYMPEDEERNSLSLLHRRVITQQRTNLTWNASANFEQCVIWLNLGLAGVSAVDADPEYTWTFNKNLTASNAQKTGTLEVGDDQQAYDCAYAMVEQLEYQYNMGETVQENHTLFARFPAKASFASLTAPTIEDIVAQKTTVAFDPTWANLGNSVISGMLATATVRIPTGLTIVNLADGSLEFGSVGEAKSAAEVEMTLLHTANGVTQYDNWAAGTLVFVRLKTEGSQIGAGNNRLFQIDMALRWTDPPQFFEDYNGLNAIVLSGRTFHDPTSNNELSVTVRNTIAEI